MTNPKPEERKTYAPHYRGKNWLQQRKQRPTGPKANSLHTVESLRKTNFFWLLFLVRSAHARYCFRMIDRFLNWGDHGKPKSGKIKGRCLFCLLSSWILQNNLLDLYLVEIRQYKLSFFAKKPQFPRSKSPVAGPFSQILKNRCVKLKTPRRLELGT